MAKTVKVAETFDVESIERALANMWQETTAQLGGEEAVLRARTANLVVFLADESLLSDTQQTIAELAATHPCRALVLVGDRTKQAKDIEVYITAFCPNQNRSRSTVLCCEQITLTASGEFVSELPSAAIPLLIPDLTTFLWWRDEVRADDEVFKKLLMAADRLIIDSADFPNAPRDFAALARMLSSDSLNEVAVTDMNWERLTPWRTALANFYDIPSYRDELEEIDRLRIDYIGHGSEYLAAQPLLSAGWLASRLKWKYVSHSPGGQSTSKAFLQFARADLTIDLELNRSSDDKSTSHGLKPGRIFRVELQRAGNAEKSGDEPVSFVVYRSEDGLYLETSAHAGKQSCPGCRVRFRNLTTAQLLSREMEILCADKIYEEAIQFARLLL